MSTTTSLDPDENGEAANQREYRCMIDSLLYLTAIRPNIPFVVCLCARFQASLASVWIQIWEMSVVLPLSILCRESRFLVSWCAGDMWDMAGINEDHDRSRRSSAEDREWWSTCRVLGGRTVNHYVRYALRTRRRGTHVSWFVIKTKVDGFSRFGLKTGGFRFLDLASKLTAMVCWFGPQNCDVPTLHKEG
jgi:hypothetical protein